MSASVLIQAEVNIRDNSIDIFSDDLCPKEVSDLFKTDH